MPSIVEITVKFTDDEPVLKALMRESNGKIPGVVIKRKLKQIMKRKIKCA